jgi:hypothetical protein
MTLAIPEGFKPSYDDLYRFVETFAFEQYIVSPLSPEKMTADEMLKLLRAFRRTDKRRAKNLLEGKTPDGSSDD